jgi:hypothetical protein
MPMRELCKERTAPQKAIEAVLDHDPQTADGVLTVATFEELLRISLAGLFEELSCSDWYVREHEMVNLFAFGHLLPAFQARGLDPTMIGIEFPAMQVSLDERSKFGARKDLVIWPEGRTTLWKGCKLTRGMNLASLHALGRKPFAVIEWKASSLIIAASKRSAELAHGRDVDWLRRNLDGGMMTVGHAVLVRQRTRAISMQARKVSGSPAIETIFLTLPEVIPE